MSKRRNLTTPGGPVSTLLRDRDHRRLPGAVEHGLLGPIGADPDREIACRRRKPVGFLVLARRLVPEIEGQAAIVVVLQRLVLGAEREAVQRVWVEEMFGVVHRQRPEALRRRQ